MITSSRNVRVHWFRSFSIVPGDQPARILENQSISRPQPQSFAPENDPSPIIWLLIQKTRQAEFVPFYLPGYGLYCYAPSDCV